MTKVTLVCEGERIGVDLAVVRKSNILKSIVEDTDCEGEIPIPNTQLNILKKILEYCEHYRDSEPNKIKQPLVSMDLAENGVNEWDIKFIDLERPDDLIDLIVAANFLDIESLINLACAKIASFIKGSPLADIQKEENKIQTQ